MELILAIPPFFTTARLGPGRGSLMCESLTYLVLLGRGGLSYRCSKNFGVTSLPSVGKAHNAFWSCHRQPLESQCHSRNVGLLKLLSLSTRIILVNGSHSKIPMHTIGELAIIWSECRRPSLARRFADSALSPF